VAIESGQQLLHYRLIEKIGEGGMGVVWKAVDTTLDREIAVKVLPDTFSGDPERLVRFEREAKLLASLQHPNIAVLHGLHEAEGVRFLAMELVGGEDLTERLARGPLPLVESIDAAIQIAEALTAAHDSGVMHRDLKPANVRIAPDGQIKVLDFGLAKAIEANPSELASADPALSPTLTSAGTVAGVILGTAAYMSPEQARGRPVDRRGDVWSFGCVLYEMLTGRQAFAGETVSDMIAGILAREPDWDHLPAEVPAGVRRVLRRCLQKDVRERTRDLGDVALDLREAREEPSSEPEAAVVRSSQSKVWPALTTLLLVALIVSIGTRWWPGSSSRSGLQADHLVVEMKPLIDKAGAQHSGALSPDGKGLLYVADEGGDQDVFFQRVGGENPINLTRNSPEGDLDPEFSPDGERIAFHSDRDGGGIFVMGATGESPRRVSDMGYEPAWSPDGKSLVFSTHPGADPYWARDDAELWVVDVETLDQRRLPHGGGSPVAPRFSPNGHRIAFWSALGGQRDVYTIPAEGGEPVPVTDDPETDWSPFWSRDGRWLFFVSDRGGTPDLWRVPIDERSGRVVGPVQPVTTGVARVWEASMARDASRVVLGINGDLGELAKVTLDPEGERLTGEPVTIHTGSDPFVEIDLSPNAEWIAFRTMGSREHVMIVRTDGSEQRQLTNDRNRNRGPRWSPNGEWLVIYSNRDGEYKIWALRPDGTGLRRLTDGPEGTFDPVWSPDGSRLAVMYDHEEDWATGFLDLPAEGIDGLEEIPEFSKPAGAVGFFAEAWSPDGRHLVGGQTVGSGSIAAVYSIAEDRVDLMHDPEGAPIFFSEGSAGWIDENRALVADQNSRNAYVQDLRSGTVRVLPGIPVPGDFTIGDGGRTLILSRTRLESDIWMLSLGE
jgi:serine/threonine protein kinase